MNLGGLKPAAGRIQPSCPMEKSTQRGHAGIVSAGSPPVGGPVRNGARSLPSHRPRRRPRRPRPRGARERTVRRRFVRRKGDWPCACTAARCATSASRRKGKLSCAARAGRRRSSPAAIACTPWGIGRRRSRRPSARRATRSPAASPVGIAGPTWPMPCGRPSAPCRAGTAESRAPIRAVGATGRAAPRTRLAGSRFWRRGPRGRASASIGPVPACTGFEGFGSVFRRGEEGL